MDRDETTILIARENDRVALRTAVAAGRLERLRWGAYRETVPDYGRHPAEVARLRARDRILAVHRQLRSQHVFSHESAALLWGAPLWEVPRATHVLQAYRAGATAAADLVRHRPMPAHWVTIDGIPVTTREQTVVDCLTTMHPLHGLVIADWALRSLVLEEVHRLLDDRPARRGRRRARTVLDLADRGAESPWETWLRYLALRAGLPRPSTQMPVDTRLGRFFVDLGWREHRVLAEFDGRVKYTDRAFGSSYDAESSLFDEKVREDAIAETLRVRPARFTARDARDPRASTARLMRLFPAEVQRSARIDPTLPLP
jgi:hypothetical protein